MVKGEVTVAQSQVAVFHPGTQHSWQTARALQALDVLEWYATSIYYQPDRWPYRLERMPGPIGRKLRQEFRRFHVNGLDPAHVRAFGTHEWLERLASRAGLPRLAARLDRMGNVAFGKAMEREIASDRPFHLWGYDNSSLKAFEVGRRHGRHCILDRTIGDMRAYNREMNSLQESYGEWFLHKGEQTDPEYIERAAIEHELADTILVGCPFAARTLEDYNPPEVLRKVEVLNYSFDATLYDAVPAPRPVPHDRPVRFLHLGLVIPRKGIQHTLEAMMQLPESEASLTVVGNVAVPPHVFARFRDRITHIPTVARADVPRIMAEHDVFVFPTYFEGAGIVLYEALACGMALIQTDRAASAVTPDTGILLPYPDTELLLAAMREMITDRAKLDYWRFNAQAASRQYQFSGYVDRVHGLLERIAASA